MKTKTASSLLALAIAAPLAVTSLPKPYKDGCSGGMSWFYRNVLGKVPAWEGCCDTHDKVYGPGGTSNQKAAADWALYECVRDTDNRATAGLMLVAVAIGGQPFFPMGWRWGYERDYGVSWWYARAPAE